MQSEIQMQSSEPMPIDVEPMPIDVEPMPISQKKIKKKDDFVMPNRENYSILLSFNYTIKQLKEIATHHKIKINSTLVKADIVSKIYNYFKHYDNAVIIQRAWRLFTLKQYNKLRGPARFNRKLCVNETDFFTMDEVRDIPYRQFFSFQDSDNMIYGFDVMSIYNLFHKGSDNKSLEIKGVDTKTTNPYNRNVLTKNIKKNLSKLIWFSRLFKEEINVNMDNEEAEVQTINGRCIAVFHDMDILGNYTNPNWFLSLNHGSLVRFIMELNDIWSYRANLSDIVKREICPHHRDMLFRVLYMVDIRAISLPVLQDFVLSTIEMLVRNGINRDSQCLGSNFVLCALTLVNTDAANALPWLFQSVL
jgi:hypothetical protein